MNNKDITSAIEIKPLEPAMEMEACHVLARAFMTNPLHVAAFGPDQLAKNIAFFRTGLSVMKGTKLAAQDGSRIIGLIHWVHAPDCRFSGFEKLRMIPAMISGFGLHSAVQASRWLSAWSNHDPEEPHLHLGPIGIEPSAQNRGIGQQLMERYCDELERSGKAGYLETDRQENVGFYRRFEFEVADELQILGVKNYFMWRKRRK